MPDISMCDNKECTLKENCYRFKARPNDWQSYGDFSQDENMECKYYWEVECSCCHLTGGSHKMDCTNRRRI